MMPKVFKAFLDTLSEDDANRVAYFFDSVPDSPSMVLDEIARKWPNCTEWSIPEAE